MKKYGKKYVEASKKVEKNNLYTAEEAIKLVKDTSVTKFDSTVEVAIKLNLDTKKADQQLRGSLVLPNGTGKTKRVLVIAKGAAAEAAKAAGADFVGEAEMIDKIEKENWFDYDVIVCTPDMMAQLGKLGKVLGPKGLMPNPKTGTVTMDVAAAVKDAKAGKVEYRADKQGMIHCPIGKVQFSEEDLVKNYATLADAILKSKPSSAKGTYVKSVYLSTTMGPGIKLDPKTFAAEVKELV